MTAPSFLGRLRRQLNHGLRLAGLEIGRSAPFLRRSRAYQPPRKALAMMPPSMLKPISTPAGRTEPDGELYRIWKTLGGSVKYHHYFPVYEEVVAPLRNAGSSLLEIGVMRGSSLEMWSQYLGANATVVGLDIQPATKKFENTASGRLVRIGDQSDPVFLRKVIEELGPFDVIIDDGSHVASHMIASFNNLFIDGLKSGGAYIVEDTHTNYWNGIYRDGQYSFMQYARDVADLVNYHHSLCDSFKFTMSHPERCADLKLPRISAELHEVRFMDSIVIFRKTRAVELPVMEITTQTAFSAAN